VEPKLRKSRPQEETQDSEPRHRRLHGFGGLLTAAGTLVALTTAIVGLVFLLEPDLKPKAASEVTSARMTDLRIDAGAPFSAWLNRVRIDGLKPSDFTAAQLAEKGVLATFLLQIVGYEGDMLPIDLKLVDQATGETLVADDSALIEPDRNDVTLTRDVWLPLPKADTTAVFTVELLVKRGNAYIPLYRLESKPFSTRNAREGAGR
jgi:hypothetical protein